GKAQDLSVNFGDEFKKKAEELKGKLPANVKDKIFELAGKAVPGLNKEKFDQWIDKAADLLRANGGNIGAVLGKLKEWFGKKDEPKPGDPKKDPKKPDEAESSKEDEVQAGEKGPELVICEGHWRPIENVKFAPVIPYTEYTVQ